MRHPDPETLALSALGEDVLAADARAHVLACETCHDEVESLRRAADAVRGGAPAPRTAPDILPGDAAAPLPPARVWRAVAAELGVDPALLTDPARPGLPTVVPAGRPDRRRGSPDGPVTTGSVVGPPRRREPAPRPAAAPGVGRSGPGRRRRRALGALSVAAVAVLAAALGSSATLWWTGRAGTAQEPRVLLAAPLSPVPDAPPGAGTAEIVATSDGDRAERALRLDLSDLSRVSGYHEVWLIDAESGRMVSLGVLPGAAGAADATFPVPADLDLSTYALVDISDEPLDGDPTHSGVSLLRGTLAAAPATAA